MTAPVYTFDHGLTVPLRTAVYDGIVLALADLTMTAPPVTETAYGPFLRTVRPLPLSLRQLYEMGEEQHIHEYVPTEGPAVAVYCVGQEIETDNRSRSRITVGVEIFFSSSVRGQPTAGGLLQSPHQPDRMRDPGANVIEDLLLSRLHTRGLDLDVTAPAACRYATLTIDAIQDVGFMVEQIWRVMQGRVAYEYTITDTRDADAIDGARARHTVPEDAGAPIDTQGLDYT